MISNSGHDERGKYSGGKAGDQTGTEWKIRSWYNGNWNCVLRHPNSNVRNDLATVSKLAAQNNLVGYDQGERLTYYNHLKASNWNPSKITIACEDDCSAGVSANVIAVGHRLGLGKLQQLSKSNTTSSLRASLKAIGFEVLTNSKYLTSDQYLLPGDIILRDGHHVCVNVSTGRKVGSTTTATTTPSNTGYSKTQFIKDVQSAIGAKVDGVAGNETLSKTITVSRTKNNRHAVVLAVQKYLNYLGYSCGTADGIAGAKFDSAAKSFQKSKGCIADGEITAKCSTWKKLLGLA